MGDMTVTVEGLRVVAERACRMVFPEDASRGPVRPAPERLLPLLDQWPGPPDQAIQIALELPWDFSIERDMGPGRRNALVLSCCRITVLHQGQVVGYALRTDAAGLAALDVWERQMAVYQRKLRQAH